MRTRMVNSHPDLLPVSRSLPSTACHHDYLARPRISCKWSLASLTQLIFIHIVLLINSLFLLFVEKYSVLWIYHCLFIYTPVEGRMFQVLGDY